MDQENAFERNAILLIPLLRRCGCFSLVLNEDISKEFHRHPRRITNRPKHATSLVSDREINQNTIQWCFFIHFATYTFCRLLNSLHLGQAYSAFICRSNLIELNVRQRVCMFVYVCVYVRVAESEKELKVLQNFLAERNRHGCY